MGKCDARQIQAIDAALADWRQGDLALEESWFTHIADPREALTSESAQADGGMKSIVSEVEGLVVVTQTCDVVRSCAERPFLEVSPLVEVTETTAHDIYRGRRPRYAHVPATVSRRLVADLDRVMTVEKSVAAKWQRTPGWSKDQEARAFAQALARKRTRFAFPDDFVELVSDLRERILGKHDKKSEEGQALRDLREIRVRAVPSWEAEAVELMFWFIRDADTTRPETTRWNAYLVAWLDAVPPRGRFTGVDGVVTTLEDLRAQDYVESDPLDLDYLSPAK